MVYSSKLSVSAVVTLGYLLMHCRSQPPIVMESPVKHTVKSRSVTKISNGSNIPWESLPSCSVMSVDFLRVQST